MNNKSVINAQNTGNIATFNGADSILSKRMFFKPLRHVLVNFVCHWSPMDLSLGTTNGSNIITLI